MSEKKNSGLGAESVAAKDPRSVWTKFMSLNGSSILLATIAAFILFEIILQVRNPGSGGLLFMTPSNLMGIVRQQVYIGVIAFGLTLVMLTGNIDLSVGNMLTFLCCICAKVMMATDNLAITLLVTLGLGILCGVFNGVLVSYVKLNSFITTLGSSSIYSALALMVSAGTILVIPDNCSAAFRAMGKSSIGPIHILIVWFVLVAVVLGLLLSRTVYGQQLYAIGANPIAARFSGIRYKRNITIAYIITGLCVALAAVVMMANSLSSNPQSGSSKEMEVILCVVLGGVAVNGGKGSVWGTVIGILFYGVLSAGFTSLRMPIHLQWAVMGLIMLVALSLDVLKGKGVKLWKRK